MTKSQRFTDSAGNLLTNKIDLDPWGLETLRTESPEKQPHRYTTYERDKNKSDEAMYRRYTGSRNRFDQPDPYDGSYDLSNPQSFNRYSYVQNDPVNFVDPSGLAVTWGCGAQYSFEQCGGNAGFWGGSGVNSFGGHIAEYNRLFEGIPQSSRQSYAEYQLQREVDNFFNRLPADAHYLGGLTWGWSVDTGEVTYSYSVSFRVSLGLDTYFNWFAGGFVIGNVLTDMNTGAHSIVDREAGKRAFDGGGAGGSWDERPNLYRGGTNLTPQPNEIRIKDDLVQTTHGISVFSNPAKIPGRFSVFRVVSIPIGLQVIQRGRDPEHFEITPSFPMSYGNYVGLLNQIQLAPYR